MTGHIFMYQWFCRNIKRQHFILAAELCECFLIWQDDIISAYQKLLQMTIRSFLPEILLI